MKKYKISYMVDDAQQAAGITPHNYISYDACDYVEAENADDAINLYVDYEIENTDTFNNPDGVTMVEYENETLNFLDNCGNIVFQHYNYTVEVVTE